MSLPDAREGESLGFHAYARVSDEGTLGDPEQIIWSSIRHVCSRSFAEALAAEVHGVKRKADRQGVARNVKLYVQQSSEFYEAARNARPNTAPLIYYYAFLNLAKALCEFKSPYFHERQECYRHGLSWKPDPKTTVNMLKEAVFLTTRGVWHSLWEALRGAHCSAANPTKLCVRDLFAYCPEISVEFERSFGEGLRTLDLEKPDTLYDKKKRETWIRFSIHRIDFQVNRVSAPASLAQIATPRSGYIEVNSTNEDYRTFQTAKPARVKPSQGIHDALNEDFLGLNLFTHIGREHEMTYFLPVQNKLPLRLPQVIVLYTILFWLGSLVRYDPHSVSYLMDSPAWILIDGFMSQSRLWLLEQFEWAIYQAETTLWLAR